jgi:uncharacterized damage-inducible protein DinB
MNLAEHYLETALDTFHKQKALADKALAQLSPEHYTIVLDQDSNSVAVIMKHMAGNMRSRWSDFLTTDGEKPNRNRDEEFVDSSLEAVLREWDEGWAILFNTLESLTAEDVPKIVTIRGQPHSVMQAIERQVDHYAYHVGQIVFLAKHLSLHWQSLSIPKGKSRVFNQTMNDTKH